MLEISRVLDALRLRAAVAQSILEIAIKGGLRLLKSWCLGSEVVRQHYLGGYWLETFSWLREIWHQLEVLDAAERSNASGLAVVLYLGLTRHPLIQGVVVADFRLLTSFLITLAWMAKL